MCLIRPAFRPPWLLQAGRARRPCTARAIRPTRRVLCAGAPQGSKKQVQEVGICLELLCRDSGPGKHEVHVDIAMKPGACWF